MITGSTMVIRRLWVLALILVVGLLAVGCGGEDVAAGSSSGTQQIDAVPAIAQMDIRAADNEAGQAPSDKFVVANSGSTVEVTVVGLTGYEAGELAGTVMQEADGLVVGGFASRIDDDPFTTTETVVQPAEAGDVRGLWPHLSDEVILLEPGEYVLTLWVDTGLGAYTRWFPLNTDSRGLAGCVQRFVVGADPVTEVTVGGDVRSTGYVGVCEPIYR